MELGTLVATVTDEEGQPLAGAVVTPVGMRSKEEPGTGYGWGPRHIPGVSGGTTDAKGEVAVSFPAHPHDDLTTGTVIVSVEHDGSCPAHVELAVDNPEPIRLTRGCAVRLSAREMPAITFSEVFADVEPDNRRAGPLKWRREAEGLTLSASLPNGKYLARLAAVTSDGKNFFSEPQPFTVTGAEDGRHLAFSLKEGRTVRGRLDPSIPRPIAGGWVFAHVTSPKRVENACGVMLNSWNVSVPTAADGSFILAGIPEGTLEMIAGCAGYISTEVSERTIEGIRHAQVMPDDDNGPFDLAMERTGDARITVLGPTGRPVPDAAVNLCPNQSVGRCTSIVGSPFNSIDLLRALHGSSSEKPKITREFHRFFEKTDAVGVALIRGLPPGVHRIFVFAEGFDLPIADDPRPLMRGEVRVPRREAKVLIPPGKEGAVTVRLELKGSTSLSEAITAARWNPRRCG